MQQQEALSSSISFSTLFLEFDTAKGKEGCCEAARTHSVSGPVAVPETYYYVGCQSPPPLLFPLPATLGPSACQFTTLALQQLCMPHAVSNLTGTVMSKSGSAMACFCEGVRGVVHFQESTKGKATQEGPKGNLRKAERQLEKGQKVT